MNVRKRRKTYGGKTKEEWKKERTLIRMNEWTNERMNECMNKWMNEWMNECMDVWMMNEWMNEEMKKWTNERWMEIWIKWWRQTDNGHCIYDTKQTTYTVPSDCVVAMATLYPNCVSGCPIAIPTLPTSTL